MIDKRPILFFDSGVGGLSTLFECVKILPNEKFFYYADEINMPFGNKMAKALTKSIEQTISNLISQTDPKVVVLACNTASALVLQRLRMCFKDILFVGTEPAVILALKTYKKPLVLCTKITNEHSKILNFCKIYKNVEVFCPKNLAFLVEQNAQELKNITQFLPKELKICATDFDCVVLGCTHYILVKKQISKYFNNIPVFDGNRGVANRLKQTLEFFDIFNTDGGVRFLNKGKVYTRLVCTYTNMLGGD